MTPTRCIPPNEWRRVARALTTLGLPAPQAAALRLRRTAIRRGYRAQALRSHPDRAAATGQSEDTLTARFQQIQAAYDLLRSTLGDAGELTLSAPVPPQTRARTAAARTPQRTPTARRPAARAAPPPPPRGRRNAWSDGPPARRLVFGQYLFYTGRITMSELTRAVGWQQQRRPRVGEIAQDWGFISPTGVEDVLRHRRPGEPFCAAAVRLGHLTRFEQLAVLGRQRKATNRIGRWFVDTGVMTEAELNQAVAAQAQHNARHQR